jgi:hypothetical protein
MSEQCTIYGCIEGAWRPNDDVFYFKNKEVIDALPEQDEWPPLNRGMFGVPMPISSEYPGFYRVQVIHFGTSINHFDLDWAEWLEKFENLLRQMYWFRAHVHIDLQSAARGRHEYLWEVTGEAAQRFYLETPLPVNEWTFTGGPRIFE